MDTLNDPKFVQKLIAGDATAFSALCNALKSKLPEFLVRKIGLNYADAEEVAGNVLYKLHGAIQNYQPKSDAKLTTWIFEIAKNAAIDRKRRLDRQSISPDGEQEPQAKPRKERHPNILKIREQEGEMLGERDFGDTKKILPYKAAFEKLDERDRDILRMRNIMEYSEISVVEAEEVGALRTRHSRALKRLLDSRQNGGD